MPRANVSPAISQAERCVESVGIKAPKPNSKAYLANLLQLADVSFKKSSKRDDLLTLCTQHGLLAPNDKEVASSTKDARKVVEKVCVVKCSLRRALSLSDDEFSNFRERVDAFVYLVSRCLRRASLALDYHLTDLLSQGDKPIPDLYKQKDTYWKRWLTIGSSDEIYPDEDSRISFQRIKDIVGGFGGSDNAVINAPKGFDQVLNYAGHTLRTAVVNNAWIPLFARLARVTKLIFRYRIRPPREVTVYKVMKTIRSDSCPQQSDEFRSWPEAVQAYVVDVRTRLEAKIGQWMADDHGKDLKFERVLRFNWWMQTALQDLNARRIAISPIFGVQRAHVRLDLKTLVAMFEDIFPDHATVKALKKEQEWHTSEKSKGRTGHDDPDRFMLPEKPAYKKLKDLNDAEREAYVKERKAYDDAVQKIKASDAYVAQSQAHAKYVAAQRCVVSAFFLHLPKKKVSKGWVFSGSVATDGVSVSVQYSVSVTVSASKQRKKGAKKEATDREAPVENYDRQLEMLLKGGGEEGVDVLVLGVDPGRSNIATIAFAVYKFDEKTGVLKRVVKTWKLSRGQYYHASGIKKANRAQQKRFESLQDKWSALSDDDACLRTTDPDNIIAYLRSYSTIQDKWWRLALQHVESAAKLVRYGGKKRVLDSFFAGVKKQARRLYPNARVQVAYGSAVQTMKCTGPGEVAAPVGEAFRACVRAFGPDAVAVKDEYRSTAVDWESGRRKELVYKVLERDGQSGRVVERLRHTPSKWAPRVDSRRADHVLLTQRYIADAKIRNADRRGCKRRVMTIQQQAIDDTEEDAGDDNEGEGQGRTSACAVDEQQQRSVARLRYPEVRGLRFCPEDRKHRDRDVEAALTIGRLHCMTLLGLGRPAPFCRGVTLQL